MEDRNTIYDTTTASTNIIKTEIEDMTHSNNIVSFQSSPYFQTVLPSSPSPSPSQQTTSSNGTLEEKGGENMTSNNSLKFNPTPSGSGLGSLATQLCPLGPKDRCTPSQAQAMGQQILSLMITHENNKTELPYELQNTFDIFHRCLAVAYGTFFLHLYTKANAPCLLCHGCKSLYPPGQYIHHACPALPPNVVPCRSRMWRRCLVPLVSQDIDKTQQKERWRFVLEKFSHNNMGVVRRNKLPAEVNLLDMPECKRGRFVKSPSNEAAEEEITPSVSTVSELGGVNNEGGVANNNGRVSLLMTNEHTILFEQDDEIIDEGVSQDGHTPPVEEPPIATIQPVPILSGQQQKRETPTTSLKGERGGPGGATTSKTFEILGQLIAEIKRLENELETSQNKLQLVEKQLHNVTKSSNVSEQLVHSLLAQDKLTIERDQALERAKQAEDKVAALQEHIQKIQKLQSEIIKSTSSLL